MMKHELRYIPPDQVAVKDRFRKDYDLTDDFVDNIRTKGVIQPIIVDDECNLLAGGRRLAAALRAELKSVPVVFRSGDDPLAKLEIELFENIHRLDMRWDEECALTAHIHEVLSEQNGAKWSQNKTAGALNKSKGKVSREIQLARMLDKLPVLRQCATEDAAVAELKKLQEQVLVNQMKTKKGPSTGAKGQPKESFDELMTRIKDEETQQTSSPGVSEAVIQRALTIAESNYMIGDALAGMSEFIQDNPTSVVSFIEVDPPYAINLQAAKNRVKEDHANLDLYNEIPDIEYEQFLQDVATRTFECASKNCWMIFWHAAQWYETVSVALSAAGWSVDPIPAIWTKGSGQTKQPEVNLARTYEQFLVCRKGAPVLRNRGRSNVFEYKPEPTSKKYHPTQRPLALMQEILQTFAYPRAVVMVPFLGSGTTLRAVYQEGMLGFGWDLTKRYKDLFLLAVHDEVHQPKEQEETRDAQSKPTSTRVEFFPEETETGYTEDDEKQLLELLGQS